MRILVVEDEEMTRHLLESSLKKAGYDVVGAEDCEKAYEIFLQGGIDFIITDWMVPGRLQGVDLVNRIRSMSNYGYVYVILLTSKSDKKDILEGISAGVDDYVRKPFDLKELKIRVQMGQKVLYLRREIEELKEKASRVCDLGALDPVTGVYNRIAVLKKIDDSSKSCLKQRIPLGIVLINVEKIRTIRFAMGYKFFDEVALEIVKRLNSLKAPHDFIGRLGDDEFVIVLPDATSHTCYKMGDRVKHIMEKESVKGKGGVVFQITPSIGISVSDPESPKNSETLILQAFNEMHKS